MDKKQLWRICCGLVILLVIATFTPLVTPKGHAAPYLFNMPYTLWMGILVSLLLLALTVLGSKVHPGSDETTKNN